MTKFINFVSLKGSIVLSAKESILSRSSHHKSERIFVFLSLFLLTLLLGSCSVDKDNEVINDQENHNSMKPIDSLQFMVNSRKNSMPLFAQKSATPSGWTRTNGPRGIARFHKTDKMYIYNRQWHVIKVWLPRMRISPIYQHPLRGNNPVFTKRTMLDWFNVGKMEHSLASFNGSFFFDSNNSTNKTLVSHSLGQWGRTLSSGGDPHEAHQMTLYISNKKLTSNLKLHHHFLRLISMDSILTKLIKKSGFL